MFITVICCEKIAFEETVRKQNTGVWTRYFGVCVRRPHHCRANSSAFQVAEILQIQFQDFAGGVGTL